MIYKAEECIPANEYIILQPGKIKEIYQEIEVPDDEKNKGKKAGDVKETKTIKHKIQAEYRVGKVLAMHTFNKEGEGYNVGDWVAYNQRQAKTFDLLAKKDPDPKCPVLIKHWDVIAKVENDKLN